MKHRSISFHKRFSNRLSFWVLGLLFVGQFLSLMAVNHASYQNARENITESLDVAEVIVRQVYQDRIDTLQNIIQVMTADYGFKKAFSSYDVPTIVSAMNNHSKRIEGADWMILVSLDEEVIANTKDPSLNGKDTPYVHLIEKADESDDFVAEGIGFLNGEYAQVLVAPLLNPDVAAWVIVGFAYDDQFSKNIKSVARADISLIDTQQKVMISSSLARSQKMNLNIVAPEEEMILEGERFLGKSISLSAQVPQFQVLVQKSVDRELISYFALRQNLLIIFVVNIIGFGIVVFKIARDISQPVSELTKATQEVEVGNFSYRLPAGGDDEMGLLMRSFDHMVADLSEKEKIRNLLGKVVSQEIANELLTNEIELGGEEKYVTILFSDIRGFTNACEGEKPHRILDLLNIYLTEVANIIESKQGVVDKFIGDAVMALFGAPIQRASDAQNAVEAALAMESMLEQLNVRLEKQGYSNINIGIGIHSGIVVAGNMGSERRLNYTVIGDNVNLSARLEGLTKFYGVSTIVSASTKEHCSHDFLFLDCVQVKGKTEYVRIFSPLQEPLSKTEQKEYDEAILLYIKGEFEQARIRFLSLFQSYDRFLYSMYHDRCMQFAHEAPEDWNGVFRFTSK